MWAVRLEIYLHLSVKYDCRLSDFNDDNNNNNNNNNIFNCKWAVARWQWL
jgi:hypothetical protein